MAYHIALEGTSGSGKTSQAKRLVEKLKGAGVETLYVKSPNGHPFSHAVTQAILVERPDPLAEIMAFAASYCQIVNSIIRPSLERDIWVVSDRGIGAAMAHALYRHQDTISREWFEGLMLPIGSDHAVHPDLTILLSISPSLAITRKSDTEDRSRIDELDDASIREARGYEQLALELPNWKGVDAAGNIDEVEALIWAHVETSVHFLRPLS